MNKPHPKNSILDMIIDNLPVYHESFFMKVKEASLLLRALNNKFAQQILKVLEQHSSLTVTQIYIHLRLEQSVASQHLAILRRAKVVMTRREGKFIYYEINQTKLGEIKNFVESLVSEYQAV